MAKIKVLVIDDEEDVVELLTFRLTASGDFDVQSAMNGPEGLDKALAFLPDVVLLDLMMPGMDGWEVARRLRESPETKSIPIIMMTANVNPDLEKRAHESLHRIFFKPLDFNKLVDSLRNALPRPSRTSSS